MHGLVTFRHWLCLNSELWCMRRMPSSLTGCSGMHFSQSWIFFLVLSTLYMIVRMLIPQVRPVHSYGNMKLKIGFVLLFPLSGLYRFWNWENLKIGRDFEEKKIRKKIVAFILQFFRLVQLKFYQSLSLCSDFLTGPFFDPAAKHLALLALATSFISFCWQGTGRRCIDTYVP